MSISYEQLLKMAAEVNSIDAPMLFKITGLDMKSRFWDGSKVALCHLMLLAVYIKSSKGVMPRELVSHINQTLNGVKKLGRENTKGRRKVTHTGYVTYTKGRLYYYNGELMCVSKIAKECGITPNAAYSRIKSACVQDRSDVSALMTKEVKRGRPLKNHQEGDKQ